MTMREELNHEQRKIVAKRKRIKKVKREKMILFAIGCMLFCCGFFAESVNANTYTTKGKVLESGIIETVGGEIYSYDTTEFETGETVFATIDGNEDVIVSVE